MPLFLQKPSHAARLRAWSWLAILPVLLAFFINVQPSVFGAPPSADADLAGLSPSDGMLNPIFDPATTSYTASVGFTTGSITITPVGDEPNALVKVNGQPVAAGDSSNPIPLSIGDNAISTVVTAQDGMTTKTYTVTVNRGAPAPGDPDPDFGPALPAEVATVAVQPDGRILLGAIFSSGNGQGFNYLTRLLADGTVDPGFNPQPSSFVYSIAVQADGKILIGGDFVAVNGQTRFSLARLNADGSVDPTFNPNVNSTVNSIVVQPDGRILIAGSFDSVGGQARTFLARLNANGTLDSSFNPDLTGDVETVALQADGAILIGGSFTQVDDVTLSYAVRLTPAGHVDVGFHPNPDAPVRSLAIQADGSVLLGGDFTHAAGVSRNGVARFSKDGVLDFGFDPSADGSVASLVVQADGKILMGGFFGFAAGQISSFVRLNGDGTADRSFAAPNDGSVNGIALQPDGRVLLAGNFTMVGGGNHRYLARLENDAATQVLSVDGTARLQWLRGGSTPETGLVTFELSTDGGATYTLLGNGTRIAGGWELTGLSLPAVGHVRARARISGGYFNGSSGVIEATKAFGLPATPEIVVEQAGTVLVDETGNVDLGTVDVGLAGTPVAFVVRNAGGADLVLGSITLTGAQASDFAVSLPSTPVAPGASTTFSVIFAPGATGLRAAALHLPNNDANENPFDIALKGTGTLSHDASLAGIAFDGTLSPAFDPTTTSYMAVVPYSQSTVTIAVQRERASAAVTFNGAAGSDADTSQPIPLQVGANSIAIVVTAQDGTTKKTYTLAITRAVPVAGKVDERFSTYVDSDVYATAVQPDGGIVFAGAFTQVGSSFLPYLARLSADGEIDAGFAPNPSSLVYCVLVQPDGKIVIGGDFSQIGDVTRRHVARLNADGTLDPDFDPDVNDTVNSLILQADGRIVIGGSFSSVGGQTRIGLARLETNGHVSGGFNLSATMVRSMAVASDGNIYVSADNFSSNGQSRVFLARLMADGSLDSGFAPVLDSHVNALAVQADGKVILGGMFTQVGGVARSYLARVSAEGVLDAAFKPVLDDYVASIALQADGRVLIGGTFSTVNGAPQLRLARLTAAGALDSTLPSSLDGQVNSVSLQDDGQILLGGAFGGLGADGTIRHLARLENTVAAESVAPSSNRLQWLRGGTSPETQQVTFELSTNGGSTFTPLSPVVRIAGGWEVSGLTVPTTGLVRLRARIPGGLYDGSSGLVESIFPFSFPRLQLEQPAGAVLVDGSASIDFGSLVVGGSEVKTFTVKNTGAAPLKLGTLIKDGAQKTDFVVSGLQSDTIAPGDTTSFTVTFTPIAGGARTAAIHLSSNSADAAIFDVTLTGSAAAQVLPKVATTTATTTVNGATVNATVDAKGSARTITFDYGTSTAYGSSVAALPATLSSTGATPISATLTSLQSHTLYHYRVRAVGTLGTALGADKTFKTGNSVPVAAGDNLMVVKPGGALNVLANDTDADGDPLTVATKSAVNPTTAGTLALTGGRLVFTASASFSTASFTYSVKDAFGGTSAPATVNLTAGTLSIPSGTKSVTAVGETYSVAVTASGAFTVAETLPWITVTPTTANGSTTVQVTVAPNPLATVRMGTISFGDQKQVVTQAGVQAKPVLGSVADTTAIVSGAFLLHIPTQNGPVTYTATGLPPGLTLSNVTGNLSGRPSKAGTYHLSVKAKNAMGSTDVPLLFTITVSPLGTGVVGNFQGLIDRNAGLNGSLASRIQITTMATGAYSGKITTGVKATAFKGQLNADPADPTHAAVSLAIPGLAATLALTLDDASDSLTGSLSDGTHTAAVHAWRDAWAGVVGKAADVAGRYTFYLEQTNADPALPQGYGYGSFTVNATTGALSLLGKLADGSVLSGATFVGQDGQVLLYTSLYANRGTFAGQLTLTPATHALAGTPTWLKPAPLATSKDTIYRAGFGPLPLTAAGGLYTPPAKGQRVLALPAAANNADLEFTLGGLDTAMKEFDQLFTITNPSATGLTNKATIPVNANKVALPTLTAATGLFGGSFTIAGPTTALNRLAPFSGEIVTTMAGTFGYGYFLLPKAPASNETVATSPKLSGRVVLGPP